MSNGRIRFMVRFASEDLSKYRAGDRPKPPRGSRQFPVPRKRRLTYSRSGDTRDSAGTYRPPTPAGRVIQAAELPDSEIKSIEQKFKMSCAAGPKRTRSRDGTTLFNRSR